MSLINGMLKDLEARQAGASVSGDGVLEGVSPVEPGEARYRNALVSALAWTVAAAGIVAVFYLAKSSLTVPPGALPGVFGGTEAADKIPAAPPRSGRVSPLSRAEGSGRGPKDLLTPGLDGLLTLRLSNAVLSVSESARADSAEGARRETEPGPGRRGNPSTSLLDVLPAGNGNDETRTVPPAPAETDIAPEPAKTDPALARAAVRGGIGGGIRKTPLPMSRETKAEARYREALVYLMRGGTAQGEALLREALDVDPRHQKAREVLAARLVHQRHLEQAAELLRDGLKTVPDASNLAKLYARILVEQDELDRAVDVLVEASPAVQQDPDYHAFTAALLQRRGDHAGAAAVYRSALLVRPAAGLWWMGLGISLEALGSSEQALEAFRKARKSGVLGGKVLDFVKSKERALGKGRMSS